MHGGSYVRVDGVSHGDWHHVVGTWDGQAQRLYVDGRLRRTQTTGDLTLNPFSVAEQAAHIGSRNGKSEFFQGSIDELLILDRGLSEDEVQALHQMGKESQSLRVMAR
jgi:hypothetical protein